MTHILLALLLTLAPASKVKIGELPARPRAAREIPRACYRITATCSGTMWSLPDGSAYCEGKVTGTVEVFCADPPPAAKKKPGLTNAPQR